MTNYSDAIRLLSRIEGGYANHPNDRGAETYSGISRKWYPGWSGWVIIDSLKKEKEFPANISKNPNIRSLVYIFYEVEYWNKLRCKDMPSQQVAEEIFEMAVNIGLVPAVKIVQNALNLLNKFQKLYTNIDPDGKIGDETISRINKLISPRDPMTLNALLKTINGLQLNHYIKICAADETQEINFYGWLIRV